MISRFKLIVLLILITFNKGISQTIDTLIQVGNHKLHFNILIGKNTPILFEAGNGSDGSVWTPIIQDIYIATGATIITYDRAGLGESTIDTTTVSFQSEVENLIQSLNQLGFKNNFFLVSHSFGGFYASQFAHLNEGKIKGAVFIDVATPCSLTLKYANKVRNSVSEENWTLIKKYKPGLYYVLKDFPDIAEYMSSRYIPNSIPLTLIAAEISKPTKEIGETDEDINHRRKCLINFGTLPNHKYVFAAGAEHNVWDKAPELVVNEIVKLYNHTLKVKKD